MICITKTIKGLAALAVLTLAITAANAQETTGSISGTITDASGAAIKGATVVLFNSDRGQAVRTLTTNSEGFYTGTSLPLGTYTVKVNDNGFKSEAITGLVLHTSDALTINRNLIPGNAGETITVTADQVQLNFENGMSQTVINGTQIRELPLNNRNYEQLLALQPGVSYGGTSDQIYIGVSLPSGTSAQVAFSVNGNRPTSNNWTVDGADNVDRGANLTLLTYPSVDAIAEFKTVRGTYLAEFGRNASAQVDVITRSGTNQWHGSAYEFFRNDIFNANSWANKLTAPNITARPKLRYNDFGGTFGGPVRIPHIYNGTDKTFFFFSEEARRVITYVSVQPQLPTAAERVGDFTQSYNSKNPVGGATIAGPAPASVCIAYTQTTTTATCTAWGTKVTNISPTAAAYLKDIYGGLPVPDSAADLAAGLDPHTYTYNQRNVFNNNQTLVRIDHNFSSKFNVFYRYLHDTLPSTEPGGLFNGSTLPGVSVSNTTAPGTQHLGHLTYTFTPTLLVNLGYAYSSGAVISQPVGSSASVNSPDIKPTLPFSTNSTQSSTSLGVVPSIAITNLSSISNAGVYHDYDYNQNYFGDVTKVWGTHTVKAGFTYNRYEKTENATGGQQGSFTFSSTNFVPTAAQVVPGSNIASTTDAAIANFLLGNANGGFSQASAALTPDIRQNLYEAYVEDSWKATPRLTLTYGARYSYFPQPTDNNGILSNFNPASFDKTKAQTVASNGVLCVPGVATCQNANGLNSGAANPSADFINGIILGTPGSFGHASPFGKSVATSQKNNIAPRLGFAYDVFGDGKTALRGGFGTAYEQSQVNIYETPAFGNFPFVNSLSLPVATLDNPAGGTATIATALPNVNGFGGPGGSLNYKTPYTMQYSLDIQQAITSTFSLDIGYFGNQGRHLQGKVDANSLQPGAFLSKGLSQYAVCTTGFIADTCEQQLNQIRPYPGYKGVYLVETIFSSNYNGLQVALRKQFSGKSYINANYTWSRALTNSINDYSTAPQNVYNINGDYGRAVYDRTNIINFNAVYEIPFYKNQEGIVGHILGGWELSGLYQINSGLPLTVTLGSGGGTICYACTATGGGATQTSILGLANGGQINDSAGLGIMNGPDPASLRPNQVLNPNNGYGQKIHTRQNWFYRPAFVAPAASDVSVGNEKRGAIEGPGYNRLDIGIFRNFKLHEGVVFTIRGEAYNAINHTNLQNPSVAGASTAFGTISTARDNRIMQVAGKLTF